LKTFGNKGIKTNDTLKSQLFEKHFQLLYTIERTIML